MLAKVLSGALQGIEGYDVLVETDVSQGLPMFDIVGLPDSAVKEAKERVRTSIKNAGFPFPVKRITVNLSPAHTRKEGSSYDLPIAIGILVCMGVVPQEAVNGVFVAGELSLDGLVQPVNGLLPMVYNAGQRGARTCIVPYGNRKEAALARNTEIIPVQSLPGLLRHLLRQETIQPYQSANSDVISEPSWPGLDFSDVAGQDNVKRAMEISAAGNHNLLMIGPPGSGKTMMAKRFPTILPGLSFAESMEVTKIYSVAGLLKNKDALITERPYRNPHHTASTAALAGGGRHTAPGEVSLAHCGVLFLDELPEFRKDTLEVLRQPMEDGQIAIARAGGTLFYPSRFLLLASMNPCPCGYLGDSSKCRCTQNEIVKYLHKISGPLLDRIDIHTEAPAVGYTELQKQGAAESSAIIRARVEKACAVQRARFAGQSTQFNGQMSAAQIERHCTLGGKEAEIMKRAFESLGLSARAYHKILKVARTIADLDSSEALQARHVAEAIQYRSLDRKYWL